MLKPEAKPQSPCPRLSPSLSLASVFFIRSYLIIGKPAEAERQVRVRRHRRGALVAHRLPRVRVILCLDLRRRGPGPAGYCSVRQRMPFNSRCDGPLQRPQLRPGPPRQHPDPPGHRQSRSRGLHAPSHCRLLLLHMPFLELSKCVSLTCRATIACPYRRRRRIRARHHEVVHRGGLVQLPGRRCRWGGKATSELSTPVVSRDLFGLCCEGKFVSIFGLRARVGPGRPEEACFRRACERATAWTLTETPGCPPAPLRQRPRPPNHPFTPRGQNVEGRLCGGVLLKRGSN